MTSLQHPIIDDDPATIESWLDENWDPAITVAEWWQRLADVRLSAPTLPPPWGRNWTRGRLTEFFAVLAERQIMGPPYGTGNFLVIPTLLEHASPALIETFVPSILNGQQCWTQLFSEPGAGSDLAGLQTRAVRDGDEWIVNGQKLWTSGAQDADMGILIARTDPTVPKNRGITYFLIDMHQPGLDVRPLRGMTGDAHFNEVFIDDARLPADWVVGDENDGWRVANTTLRHERTFIGGEMLGFGTATPGTVQNNLVRPAGDFARPSETPSQSTRIDSAYLIEIARDRGRADDPLIREGLARLYTLERVTEWHMGRAKAGSASTGVEGNLAKIRNTEVLHAVRALTGALLGPDACLWGADAATGGVLQHHTVNSPAPSIYGGSDQIQRNIIGQRGLGLPYEPDPSRELPFDELLHNPTRH